MTLPGYLFLRQVIVSGGKLSWIGNCNHHLGKLSLASLRGRIIEYQLRLGYGGKVTASWWQVTQCDPIWYVISRSGELITTNCYTPLYLYL